ncbi:MAG: energy-coupling factor transporter transmembrane protein EcfT [Mycoplasmataceae bacterium]|nr:energy-coupling factor transporter transmembrane protein EcfT [Mycoplasmataceae bacterium]
MFKGILIAVFVMFLLLTIINFIMYKSPSFSLVEPESYLFNFYNFSSIQINGKMFYYNTDFRWFFKEDSGLKIYPLIASSYQDAINELNRIVAEQFNWGDATKIKFISIDALHNGNNWVFLADTYVSTAFSFSSQVFVYSFYITLKIFLIITIITILISSTSLVQLSFAINDVMLPLKIFRAPINEWSMVISTALRFVASLLEESKKIMAAQSSRGVDFENGNLFDKIKSLVSLVVPMFSVSFFKASELATAMEARLYNPRYSRSRYRSFSYTFIDFFFLCFVSFLFGFFIYLVIVGKTIGTLAIFDSLI